MCRSDRCRVFVDLLNLSAYEIPRHYLPPLTQRMLRSMSIVASGRRNPEELAFDEEEDEAADDDDDDREVSTRSTENLVRLHIY